MPSISFTDSSLTLTSVTAAVVDSVTKNNVIVKFKSPDNPDNEVTVSLSLKENPSIKDLQLKKGEEVNLEPVTNQFTLSVKRSAPDSKAASASTSKRGSGCQYGEKFSNVLA